MTARDRWLTVHTAAERLAVCHATIRRWIHTGKLPATRYPSGQYRIPAEAVAKIQVTTLHTY